MPSAIGQAHSAVQWIARIVNSYVIPASNGSHLHMIWDPVERTLESAPFENGLTVEMRLPEFVLQFKENGVRTAHEMPLDDRSPAQVEAWTLIELLHRNLDRDKYSKWLPYDVASLMSGDAADYQTYGQEEGFEALTELLVASDELLRKEMSDRNLNSEPIRFAPESFSLFASLNTSSGDRSNHEISEIGLCADTRNGAKPCFYIENKKAKERNVLELENAVDEASVSTLFAKLGECRSGLT